MTADWKGLDRAALDKSYNARESVADFENTYLPGFSEDSLRARRANPGPRNVPYGPHRDQVLDIFPAKQHGAPVHLFIHGGYWRMLTKDENSFVAEALTPMGATVMVNTYSLTPDVHLDVIVRQCRAFVVWAYKNAHRYGADNRRIYISGHSAGGHLAAMMLSTDWQADYNLPPDIVKGVTAISGLYDLAPLQKAFTNEWLQLSDMAAERNSPIHHKPPYACPVIVAWGEDDPEGFHWQGDAYLAKLKEWRMDTERLVLKGRDHFAACNEYMDPKAPLTQAVAKQMGLA